MQSGMKLFVVFFSHKPSSGEGLRDDFSARQIKQAIKTAIFEWSS
jgi:hypothetical protein